MLEFPWPESPPPGTRLRVADGIDWIRQPLPFRLDHVNCWWLDAGGAPGGSASPGASGAAAAARDLPAGALRADRVLVDTGIANASCREGLREALGRVAPEALLVTHFHPDHSGLAGHCHAHGARLIGGEVEMGLSARLRRADPDAYGALYAAWYRANGLPAEAVARVADQGNAYRSIVDERPPAEAWTWVDGGDRVALGGRIWTVRIGRGHAPRMLLLHDAAAGILIAADQVLASISPNVSLAPGDLPAGGAPADGARGGDDVASGPFGARDEDPLGSFLDSLDELRALPADTLVLPSHGRPFRGLHERLDALAAHHGERLGRVRDACATPSTAFELFEVLFGRKLDAQQMSFALGEALAHARRLERLGELRAVDGTDGVRRFVRA